MVEAKETRVVRFPCTALPEDPAGQKLLGLYRQVQEGLWLQRVKVPGGRLNGLQWRALSAAARRHTPRTPLHLTTRQDVELHDLSPADIPAEQIALSEAGLTCLGAAGDTYRNITVCPCGGAVSGRIDPMPLVRLIECALTAEEGIYSLPRKFKISLACGDDCGQAWINDVGLTARLGEGGRWGFRVIVAGSLGARPGTGIELDDWLPAGQVIPVVVAAVRLFTREGDRQNRARARLRHVRERMGDQTFLAAMRKEVGQVLAEQAWPAVELPMTNGRFGASSELFFANGDVTSEQAEALAELADDDRLLVRIATGHTVVVFGPNNGVLSARMGEAACLCEPARVRVRLVACPGRRWCSRGLVQTNPIADQIRRELADVLPAGATVCISGCPNGCSQAGVAQIGLIGCAATVDGQRREAFNVLVGGTMGRSPRLAGLIASKVPADSVVGAIAGHLAAGT
jgi:sulfite reductase beta subunit-like hemoprotein